MGAPLTVGARDQKTAAQTFIDAVEHSIPEAQQLAYYREMIRVVSMRVPETQEFLRSFSLYVGR